MIKEENNNQKDEIKVAVTQHRMLVVSFWFLLMVLNKFSLFSIVG